MIKLTALVAAGMFGMATGLSHAAPSVAASETAATPALPVASAPDRMPPIPLDKMDAAQRQYAEAIIKGPRSALYGPFIPLIRSPELMDRSQKLGEYLRYKSALGNVLSEFVILLIARRWTQQVEWNIHKPIALKAGIKPEVVQAIADGRRPDTMTADETIIYDFCNELDTTKSVSDVTYQRAVARFGERGVMDLIGLDGYYTLLAMVLNTARTASTDAKVPPLQPLPH